MTLLKKDDNATSLWSGSELIAVANRVGNFIKRTDYRLGRAKSFLLSFSLLNRIFVESSICSRYPWVFFSSSYQISIHLSHFLISFFLYEEAFLRTSGVLKRSQQKKKIVNVKTTQPHLNQPTTCFTTTSSRPSVSVRHSSTLLPHTSRIRSIWEEEEVCRRRRHDKREERRPRWRREKKRKNEARCSTPQPLLPRCSSPLYRASALWSSGLHSVSSACASSILFLYYSPFLQYLLFCCTVSFTLIFIIRLKFLSIFLFSYVFCTFLTRPKAS